MDYSGKNILVCGAARSGVAAALLLKKLGARVTVSDVKGEGELGENARELREAGIVTAFGKNPDGALLCEADMIVPSPGIPSDAPFLADARRMGVPVVSEIELAYSVCRAPVVAITGTNGKTTTTVLTAMILDSPERRAEALGNVGTAFSSKVYGLNENDYAVVEASSFQLENIAAFKPRVAVVLNITPDHLDRHATMKNYIRAKERVFENQTADDFLILNRDDPVCYAMAAKAKPKTVFISQTSEPAGGVYLRGKKIISDVLGAREEIIDIGEMKISGAHMLEDALAAAAVAVCLNTPFEKIAGVLREFRGVSHRLEYVTEIDGVEFYNDSKATNPNAAIKGLGAMKRPVVLICGGYDKHSDYAEWTAAFAKKLRKAVVIGETAEKIISACEAAGFYGCVRAGSLEEAVRVGFDTAERGDAVLLSPACASWGMFKDFEERGDKFKEYVQKLSTK